MISAFGRRLIIHSFPCKGQSKYTDVQQTDHDIDGFPMYCFDSPS